MVDLTENDVKILRYIKKYGSSSIADMENAMPDIKALCYRVEVLSTPEYRKVHSISLPIENTAFLEEDYELATTDIGETVSKPLGVYRLTAFGDKTLQDYEHQRISRQKELWLKNAWIPILVSLVTNLLIHGITELWPLIKGWASHIL